METETYTTRVLRPTAEDGWLTQSAETPKENRVFSKELYLAVNADPNDWREVTDTEKQAHEAALAARAEKADTPTEGAEP